MQEQIVYLNGALVSRDQARISIWDRCFQSGDAVYEGLRVYNGGVFQLKEHVQRLFLCAKALGISIKMCEGDVEKAILETVRANRLESDAHVRVTITRGEAPRTGMDPAICDSTPPTIAILVEAKKPQMPKTGIRLITSSMRRTPAQCLDPKLHTCNQLGQIMAKMEANRAGVDEALMLDLQGFVAETNSANVFIFDGNRLLTPRRDCIMPGFTRRLVFSMASDHGLQVTEDNISLADVYMAREMFIAGTVNQIVPVIEVDGRSIGSGEAGQVTQCLLAAYLARAQVESVPARII